jgi:RHS repeat-associated protein
MQFAQFNTSKNSFFGSDYRTFGMQLQNRHESVTDFRYGFNGEQHDSELKGEGNSYDFGNRMYDPRLGKFLSMDRLASKYASQSPYVFAGNTPVMAVDAGGDSVLLFIWKTDFKNGAYGHAAIAVQNYKNIEVYNFIDGGKTTMTIRVPDGTYTYYDLWPGSRVGSDKESTQTAVPAIYQLFKTLEDGTVLTESVFLKQNDPSRGENGKSPDGIILLATSREMDGLIKSKIENYKKDNPKYVGASNNCSDFALSVIDIIRKGTGGENFGKEQFYNSFFVTPNELFKDTKSILNKIDGQLLRENGTFDQPFINDAQSEGYGSSSPAEEPLQKSVGPIGVN